MKLPKALISVFSKRDIIMIAPTKSINKKDNNLRKINCHQTLLDLIRSPQILFIESCISPKILVAPIIRIIMLKTVVKKLFLFR